MPKTAEQRSTSNQEIVSFGPFQFFPRERRLAKDGKPVKLGSRAVDILQVLIENEGEVVNQKDIMARVWPGLFVEDVGLRVHIVALRKALDTGESGPNYLTNVPGRGYCFAAQTSRTSADSNSSLAAIYPLPLPPRCMVGRERDVREISEKIAADRLVTIVGSGGIGKTTVALAVGQTLLSDFGGAVGFVDLSRVVDPGLVASTVAAAFGLPVNSQSPIPSVIAYLRTRPTLLILDNCEHLVLETASLVEELTAGAEKLRILATSRETLRARSEVVHRLGSLESPPADTLLSVAQISAFPAVQLFVDRLKHCGTAIALNEQNAPVVGSITRKLGGIALAIELAAGRAGTLGLQETASRLDSQFALRWPGRRTAPPRHQTMNAALEWSYNLLSDNEKKTLRRLSVFVGGFRMNDASEVASDTALSREDVDEAVAGLLAKSLASGEGLADGSYRLLETTRAYAASKLEEAGEENTFRRRHARYFRALLVAIDAASEDPDRRQRPLRVEIENIRASLHWAFGPNGDPRLAVDLAAYSGTVWLGRGLFAECIDWMTRAKAVLSQTKLEDSDQQLLIQTAGYVSMSFGAGFPDRARVEWIDSLKQSARKDVRWLMLSTIAPWLIAIRSASFVDADARARDFVEVAEQTANPDLVAQAIWMTGTTAQHLGRFGEARATLKRALDIDSEGGRLRLLKDTGFDRRSAAMAEMAHVLGLQGLFDQARDWGTRAIEEARARGLANPLNVTMTWAGLNRYLHDADIDAVEHDVVELLEHTRTRVSPAYEGFALAMLGLCQLRRSDVAAARPLASKGLELLTTTGYRVFHTFVRSHLCEAEIAAGRLADARAIMSAIDSEERNPEHWCKSEVLRVKGLLMRADNDDKAGEALFRESLDLAQTQSALSWELKTAVDLARLLRSKGRLQDAIDTVARVQGRFTEGFDSLTLAASQHLLDEMRGGSPLSVTSTPRPRPDEPC